MHPNALLAWQNFIMQKVGVTKIEQERDECKLPPTMRTPPICGKSFSFGEEPM
jgi:hypothetical protein